MSYQYGQLLSGTFFPGSVFANLSGSTTDNITYNFSLQALDLNSIFTNNAFIGSVAVDTSFAKKEALPSATLVGSGNGISEISTSIAGGPGGVYDFRYVLGGVQDRLTANESVNWTSTFAMEHMIDPGLFALHVQGLTEQQGGSAFYIPTAAPVPGALPLMAYALSLFGIAGKRRKQRTSI